ncbi:MAG: 3-deoxy-D-manno-octulosonic acid transferase [Cyclobacteriaceae bacterium]
MSLLLYNIGLSLFNQLFRLASIWNNKANLLLRGRESTWEKLERFHGEGHKFVIWFHAASLGEFEQGRPIIEGLKNAQPELVVLLTFFSPSGYEIRKEYKGADLVAYLPSDSHRNAARFIELANPSIAIFIKYEFWYHYLIACKKEKVPTLSVSTIFRSSQPFFKFYGGLHRKMLSCFNHIFVQDNQSGELLETVGVRNYSISGDTRFDRVADVVSTKLDLPLIEEFKNDSLVMVLGSVWPGDMEILTPFISKYSDRIKFIIAPHNVDEKDINELLNQLGANATKYSKAEDADLQSSPVLIIDSIGLLSSLYGYGELSYVGGAFRQTLHNTLEAAAHGIPVFFGRDESNSKFREAGELERLGAGIPVSSTDEIVEHIEPLLTKEELRSKLGNISSNYIQENRGATKMIIDYIVKSSNKM